MHEQEDAGSRKKQSRHEALRIGNLMSAGFMLVIATMLGYGMGFLIDRQFHTAPVFAIVFLLFGVAAGFINLFRLTARQ